MRCVLVKWNCLLLHLFWMGSEDTRAYFAKEIRDLHQRRQFVDVDDSRFMELFHEAIEHHPHTDDLRAEVSLLKTEQEDEVDETRSNEAHLRHAAHYQDPCNTQGPFPSKPFEGLEQCLPWHQRAWDNLSRGCSCHRRRSASFQVEKQPQYQGVDGYTSHREYPVLRPAHTTQALTRVRDRVQGRARHESADPDQERYEQREWLPYMRDLAFPTSPWRTVRGVMSTRRTEHDTIRRHSQSQHSSGVPSTYLASRSLLGRDGQDSEGTARSWQGSARHMTSMAHTASRTLDHEDSRRLASGLSTDLSRNPGAESRREEYFNESVIERQFHDAHQQDPYIQGSYSSEEDSDLGRQTDPGDRRTSDWRSSTLGSHLDVEMEHSHSTSSETERDMAGNASRILMTGLRRPGLVAPSTG